MGIQKYINVENINKIIQDKTCLLNKTQRMLLITNSMLEKN